MWRWARLWGVGRQAHLGAGGAAPSTACDHSSSSSSSSSRRGGSHLWGICAPQHRYRDIVVCYMCMYYMTTWKRTTTSTENGRGFIYGRAAVPVSVSSIQKFNSQQGMGKLLIKHLVSRFRHRHHFLLLPLYLPLPREPCLPTRCPSHSSSFGCLLRG